MKPEELLYIVVLIVVASVFISPSDDYDVVEVSVNQTALEAVGGLQADFDVCVSHVQSLVDELEFCVSTWEYESYVEVFEKSARYRYNYFKWMTLSGILIIVLGIGVVVIVNYAQDNRRLEDLVTEMKRRRRKR